MDANSTWTTFARGQFCVSGVLAYIMPDSLSILKLCVHSQNRYISLISRDWQYPSAILSKREYRSAKGK